MSKRRSASAKFIGSFWNKMQQVPDGPRTPRTEEWSKRALAFARHALRDARSLEREAKSLEVRSRAILPDPDPEGRKSLDRGNRRRVLRRGTSDRSGEAQRVLGLYARANGKCFDAMRAVEQVRRAGFPVPEDLSRGLQAARQRLEWKSARARDLVMGPEI